MLEKYQETDVEAEESIRHIIAETQARYLIVTSADLADTSFVFHRALRSLLEHHPELIPVFWSGDGRTAVYNIYGHFERIGSESTPD